MGVTLTKIVEKMELRNLTPDVDMTQREVKIPDINRPALQLAGFFDHFDCERIQLIGYVEYTYLQTLEYEHKMKIYDTLLEYGIPCFIFCRNLQPDPEFLEKAVKNNIPVFITDKQTSSFSAELIRWMKVELAPCISIHGVLVDCYGVGVLIMGDSGIGKSEAALELIKRGHRLVADDAVEIRKISHKTLMGTCPELIRYLIELRGIGILDVHELYGAGAVKASQNIDIVIKLVNWDNGEIYDRLGLEEEYIEILGNKIVCKTIPLRPGRNVAVICESAAINHRQRRLDYPANNIKQRLNL